ncbi:MAG: hypothetical protein ACKVOK_12645 [Flavobacteriales bacterium]
MKKVKLVSMLVAIILLVSSCKKDECPVPTAVPEVTCVPDESYNPNIDPSNFVTTITTYNPYFPLIPNRMLRFEGLTEDGGEEIIEWMATGETKIIMGVTCFVVNDKVWVDGEVVEDTDDWFAQDLAGNVWYFGEAVQDFEGGVLVSTAGSWEAGVDGALPGIRIPADPFPGHVYRQEYYACEAEDMAQDVTTGASVTTPYDAFTNCLQTEEYTPLEADAPHEYKFYAPGIGYTRIEKIGTSAYMELVEIIE